jgi:anti-sigma factor RsiW
MSDATPRGVTAPELEAFVDGELDASAAARVEAALTEDAALRAEFDRLARERAALGAAVAGEDAPPAGLDLLAARLEAALRGRRRRRMALRAGVAVVAAAALGVGGWVAHARLTGTPLLPGAAQIAAAAGVPGFVADAAGAHAVFAASEDDGLVEFGAAEEAQMLDWFARHLGAGATVPHLEEIGFELVGGRLLGDAEGPAAQLLYRNARGDKVSLMLARRPAPGGAELKLVHVGKRYASWWREGDLAWAVVEDSPGADVSAVATHVAALVRATRAAE